MSRSHSLKAPPRRRGAASTAVLASRTPHPGRHQAEVRASRDHDDPSLELEDSSRDLARVEVIGVVPVRSLSPAALCGGGRVHRRRHGARFLGGWASRDLGPERFPIGPWRTLGLGLTAGLITLLTGVAGLAAGLHVPKALVPIVFVVCAVFLAYVGLEIRCFVKGRQQSFALHHSTDTPPLMGYPPATSAVDKTSAGRKVRRPDRTPPLATPSGSIPVTVRTRFLVTRSTSNRGSAAWLASAANQALPVDPLRVTRQLARCLRQEDECLRQYRASDDRPRIS